MDASVVPNDFPRGEILGWVAGTSPKLILRRVDGRYVSRDTDEERRERFVACEELAFDLVKVVTTDQMQHPTFTRDQALERVRSAILDKRWVSEAEADWTVRRLREHLEW